MTPERELLTLALNATAPIIRQAPKTRLDYAAWWKSFTGWCQKNRQIALPAAHSTVLTYCYDLLSRGRKVSTCERHLSAVNSYHQQAGHAAPSTKETYQFLTAVKRLRGEQPQQKRALTLEQLRASTGAVGDGATAIRARAVLLLGFASALRRSNLVGLDLADVAFREEGLVLTIRREKQDRTGEGRIVAVARGKHPETDPVAAIRAWMEVRGDAPGPLFCPIYRSRVVVRRMHPERIAYTVKTAVAGLGLNPDEYGGHSLRAGLATLALEAGVSEILVATHTGHASLQTLRLYYRRADPFRANVSAMVGL